VRCLLSTGRRVGHESPEDKNSTGLQYLLVQACQPLTLVIYNDLYTQIQLSSPYQLPSTHPVRGYQEGPPLAIEPPHSDTVLRYIVRAAT